MKLEVICGTLCVIAICASVLFGCQWSNRQYYDALNRCTDHGGTWMPNTNGVNTGLCINPHAN